MTIKQERILYTALELFAHQGVDGTPTSAIAKKAGVSEGLIFRHYTNKEGLLEAILELARVKTIEICAEIFKIPDPFEKIKAIISIPFDIDEDHYDFWKLIYSIKWQQDFYDYSISAVIKTELMAAFEELNATCADSEAETALMILDGAVTYVLLRKPENKSVLKETLINKYEKQFNS